MKKYISLIAFVLLTVISQLSTAHAQLFSNQYGRKFVLGDASLAKLTLTAPSSVTPYTLTFPSAKPSTAGNYYLISDQNGNLSFASETGSQSFSSLTITGFATAGVVHNAAGGLLSSSLIVDADITAGTITDDKLATISTAGKVANSATTATSANTPSTIVLRDASGNFIAGTITGNVTGSSGSTTGNAATVTTNANLTGPVTSVGNATAIAANALSESMVNLLTTHLSGKEPTITGGTTSQYWRGDKSFQTLDKSAVGLGNVENTALSTWAGSSNIITVGTLANLTVTNPITGSITGSSGSTTGNAASATLVATTSTATNSTYFPLFVSSSSNGNHAANLGTGLTFNPSNNNLTATTFTGTLSGNATTATTLQTAHNIYGNSFDGSASITGPIIGTYGGTNSQFVEFNGPFTTIKTFTLPNVSATILTTNSTVTVAQGGTGAGNATNARSNLGAAANGTNSDITSLTGLTTALSVGQGGTGTATAPTQGGIIYASSTSAMASTAAGTTGQVLTSAGTGTPTWKGPTFQQTNLATPTADNATGVDKHVAVGGSITPVGSGIVMCIISGDVSNNANGDGATIKLRYGTGTAPINGAAATGTLVTGSGSRLINANITPGGGGSINSLVTVPFSAQGIISGLTVSPATPVWVDITLANITGGTASVRNIVVTLYELK